jgi:putative peptide zinc metalloprotease protein
MNQMTPQPTPQSTPQPNPPLTPRTASDSAQPPAPLRLAERLAGVQVGVRTDLEVSRHLFHGRPSYIVRDPLTFQSHRLDPADYDVFVRISDDRPLSELFAELVSAKRAGPEQEESFYQFVFMLHRLGFLQLPVSDDKLLYRRFRNRTDAARRTAFMKILFLQIPLWNPDAFLSRTVHHVRFMFSRWAILAWGMLMLIAGWTAFQAGDAWREPLNGILAARNLPLIWLTLIVLKVFHEFGHAYACKYFGAHVPEMGAYLIAGTPCAYVDATASWGLPRKRERIIICLAGMYVESIFAAIAVLVWANTGSSLINALAYNVVFLAGVMTVLFNVNPLMRYDGYYILSDLLQMPNLRQRSTDYIRGLAKRWLLGVPPRATTRAEHPWLLAGFGVSATIYKTLVLFGIAAMIAYKLHMIGVVMAAAFLGMTFWGMGKRLALYVFKAEETQPVRIRAAAVTLLLLFGAPLGALTIPVPARVHAAGVLAREQESVVRAESPGFTDDLSISPGQRVAAGAPIVRLTNDFLDEAILDAEARLSAARLRCDAYRVDDPGLADQENARAAAIEAELARRRAQRAALSIVAPIDGRVVHVAHPDELGRYIEAGQEIATLVDGGWLVRAALSEAEMVDAAPRIGQRVEFRPHAETGRVLNGTITRISPGGSRHMELTTLTHLAGGDIVVQPDTNLANEAYFELTVTLDVDPSAGAGFTLARNMTGRLNLRATPEPLGMQLIRTFIRFTDKLRQA